MTEGQFNPFDDGHKKKAPPFSTGTFKVNLARHRAARANWERSPVKSWFVASAGDDGQPHLIVDVELILEILRRFLVSAVLHHVELATLLVEDCTGPDFAGALFHRRLVLGCCYFGMRFVQPSALRADHNSFAL